MPDKIIAARYLSNYSVWLRFSDGTEGTVDLSNELYGKVFEPLRSPEEFRKVSLSTELGTIVWPNGADFAPEFLRRQLRSAA